MKIPARSGRIVMKSLKTPFKMMHREKLEEVGQTVWILNLQQVLVGLLLQFPRMDDCVKFEVISMHCGFVILNGGGGVGSCLLGCFPRRLDPLVLLEKRVCPPGSAFSLWIILWGPSASGQIISLGLSVNYQWMCEVFVKRLLKWAPRAASTLLGPLPRAEGFLGSKRVPLKCWYSLAKLFAFLMKWTVCLTLRRKVFNQGN